MNTNLRKPFPPCYMNPETMRSLLVESQRRIAERRQAKAMRNQAGTTAQAGVSK